MDASGNPVLRARVALIPAATQPSRYSQISASSEFRLNMVPPGEYKLVAWESAPGPAISNELPPELEARAKTVKVGPGDRLVTDVIAISAAESAAASPASTQQIEFTQIKGSLQGQCLNAKTGEPVRNAIVQLSPTNRGVAVVNSSQLSGPRTQTDDRGNFAFSDVDPGMYSLAAEHQGFVNGIYGARLDRTTEPLVVGEGQEVAKVAIKLAPEAVVAGKVSDENGDPVVNAPVSLYTREAVALAPGLPAYSSSAKSGTTNAFGEFRLVGLAAGTYILAVRPVPPLSAVELAALPLPQQPEMRYPVTMYPDSVDPARAQPIVLESGAERTGLELKLKKLASFQVRGSLTGLPGNRPPAGRSAAFVALYPARPSESPLLPAGSAFVGPDGEFTIACVLPGSYVLEARSPGSGPGDIAAASLPVEVTGKHIQGIQLALKPSTNVKATVSWEKPTTVRLNNLFINLQSVYPAMGNVNGQMDGENSFTFRGVLPIPYKVANVTLPAGCLCFLKSLRYGGREIPDLGVDLTTGKPLEIVLSSSAAIVEGTVVDRQGKLLAGALIAVVPKDAAPAKLRTGYADETGRFYFENNPPGEYRLFAFENLAPGNLNDPAFFKAFAANAATVKLEPLGRQSLRLVGIP